METKNFKIGDKIIVTYDVIDNVNHYQSGIISNFSNGFVSFFSEVSNVEVETCFCNGCRQTRVFKID